MAFWSVEIYLALLWGVFTLEASSHVNLPGKRKAFTYEKSSIRTELVWDTNMAVVSIVWDTNIAAVTLCEDAL